MRVVALLASFNEERFIGRCLEHFEQQGIESYLLDNSSTDRTVEIARQFLGRGLREIETIPRDGIYRWSKILERKEELAQTLDADWFIHSDPDEFRLPPRSSTTLAQALAEADAAGANAVNFQEFTFVPTIESPEHDHADFQQTMRWYYPFLPMFPHRLTAWKKQSERVALAASGGHVVSFPGLKMHDLSFPMRHYLFLSIPHVISKYIDKQFDPEELKAGWHRLRAQLTPEMLRHLPSEKRLRLYTTDDAPDATNPHQKNLMAEFWKAAQSAPALTHVSQ